MPPSAMLQSGVPAASTFFESLADADDAALMRLLIRYVIVEDGCEIFNLEMQK